MSFPSEISAFTAYKYAPVYGALEPSHIKNPKLRAKAPSDPIDIPKPELEECQKVPYDIPPTAPLSTRPFAFGSFPRV